MPRRPHAVIGFVVAIVVATVAACAPGPDATPDASPTSSGPASSATPQPTPRPVPGHEVHGYVPYWEMDRGIAAHVGTTDLTTVALFSVTNTRTGALDTKQNGYRRIVGDVGRQLIREARERGVRVELVFTSFGRDRNDGFFADRELQDATIASLAALVGDLGLDGVNVDVEGLDLLQVSAYGEFVGRLRDALTAVDPSDRVSAATQASLGGAAMAAAAAQAGVDRVFLMGYDYRVNGSEPGAIAPLERRDGEEKDLVWSLDLYEALGVPVERTLLGLPLYGRAWPVTDPLLGAPATGRGETWVPRRNLEILQDPSIVPTRDEVEMVELYALASDGSSYPPASAPARSPSSGATPGPAATPSSGPATPSAMPDDRTWRAIYVDSPATLEAKLALANERGLAGAGFWAIGYERGLPGYTDLIARFAAGDPMEGEVPKRPGETRALLTEGVECGGVAGPPADAVRVVSRRRAIRCGEPG